MTQTEAIAKELISRYKKDSEALGIATTYIYVQHGEGNNGMTLSSIRKLKYTQKRKSVNVNVKSVDPIQSEGVVGYSLNISLGKNKNKEVLDVSDMTGMFKITFTDDTFMYYSKFIQGFGRNTEIKSLFAAEKNVWINFLKLLRKSVKYKQKPKNGIYKIDMVSQNFGPPILVYTEKKDLNETPIIHPEIEKVNIDLEFFFNNLGLFTRYKMPGTRKVLLVGEPGSGKTSYCIKLAIKKKKQFCCVFATNIEAIAQHMIKCAKFNIATIVILEDAEATMGNAGSSILNFLDGIDQPTNKNGCYVIMTTNYPQRIEPRILQRPGRIDKIFKFDGLNNYYALKCCETYLDGYLTTEEEKTIISDTENKLELLNLITGMTGAQIKGLVDASIALAVSTQKELSLEIIKMAKEQMFADLKDVYKYAEDNSILRSRKKTGFVHPNESIKSIPNKPEFIETF